MDGTLSVWPEKIDFLSVNMTEDNNRKNFLEVAKASKVAKHAVRAGLGDGGVKLGATTKDIAFASFEEEQAEQRSLESRILGLGEVLRSKNGCLGSVFRLLEYCTTYGDNAGVERQKQRIATTMEEISDIEAIMLDLASKKRCRPKEMEHFLKVGGKSLRINEDDNNAGSKSPHSEVGVEEDEDDNEDKNEAAGNIKHV